MTPAKVGESKQSDLFSIFGIDKATFEKSKDILPTFNLGELPVGSKVVLRFLESVPKEIEVMSKFAKKKVLTKVIKVFVDTVFKANSDGTLTEIPYGFEYSLWLSSKSLSLGLLKIAYNSETLQDAKVTISIGTADYKDFGENRCYSVTLAK
jgi:hypothetical protein